MKNSNLKHIFEEENRSLEGGPISQTKLLDYLENRFNHHYQIVQEALTVIFNVLKRNSEHAAQVLNSILEMVIYLPNRKVVSVLLKHMVKSLFTVIPSAHLEECTFVLTSFLKRLISRYNRLASVNSYALYKSSSGNLFKLESEIFVNIKYRELKEESDYYKQIYKDASNSFSYSDPHPVFGKRQPHCSEFLDLFSIVHFCDVFHWLYRSFIMMVNDLLPLLVSNKIDGYFLYILLLENFHINQELLERFHIETISLMLIANLNCMYLMKNSSYFLFNSSKVFSFYKKTLKLGLNHFAKNKTFFEGSELQNMNELSKVEKRFELAIRAVIMLRNETFYDLPSNTKTKNYPDNNVQIAKFAKLDFEYRKKHLCKLTFTNKSSKMIYEDIDANNRVIGKVSPYSNPVLLCALYNTKPFSKELVQGLKYEENFYTNAKKLLMTLLGHELDSLKAFYRQDFGGYRYDFTMEKHTFTDAEYKVYLAIALEITYKLSVYLLRKLDYALPSSTHINFVTEVIDHYSEFCYKTPVALDYFIFHNSSYPQRLKEVFYWQAPQIPTLYKYVSYKYDKSPILHILFTKIMKRLHAEQLLFYLPQIFQSMNTKAAFQISKFLLSYAKKSFLFCHQLIWKSKVESKPDEEGQNLSMDLPIIATKLLRKTLSALNPTERYIFESVDNFFENITAISGRLKPKTEKSEKKKKIKEGLLDIQPNDYLYIPCNPQEKLEKIKYDSGTPMQSAAKCPILVSFYCRKFEVTTLYITLLTL